MEPLYRGHIGTLEVILYTEVVLNSEVIILFKYYWGQDKYPLYGGCPYFRVSLIRGSSVPNIRIIVTIAESYLYYSRNHRRYATNVRNVIQYHICQYFPKKIP